MSSENITPGHAEGAAETTPLLKKNVSVVSVSAQSRSNGTFSSSSNSVADDFPENDVENGRPNGAAPNGDAPKLKVNMKALLPALAIGVSEHL